MLAKNICGSTLDCNEPYAIIDVVLSYLLDQMLTELNKGVVDVGQEPGERCVE